MSNKETFDKIFDALLDEALEIVESEPEVSLPEDFEITVSEKHRKRMDKLFAKEEAKIRRKKLYRNLQRVAACFLVFVVVSGITVMSVDAFRVKFLNFVFDNQQTNTKIRLKEAGEQYSNQEITLGYVPGGFELEKEEIGNRKIYLKFKRDSKFFTVTISNTDMAKSIDTENAEVEKIEVNDKEALYSENENIRILTLHDGEYIYTINGNISKQEVVEIARNTRKN